MTDQRWPTGAMVRFVALFFAFLIVMRFLWAARSILIVGFLGILFGLALSSGVDFLERWKVRRGLGAVAIVVAFLGLLVGVGAMVAPTLRTQIQDLEKQLPESIDYIDRWFRRRADDQARKPAAAPQQSQQQNPAQQKELQQQQQERQQQQQQDQKELKQQQQEVIKTLRQQISDPLRAIMRVLFPFISTTLAAIAAIILVLFIALYIATEPGLYRRGLLHLVPRKHKARYDEVLDEIGTSLRQWLIARLIAMLAIGAITAGVLALLRIKAWAALGVLAGLLEFIPFFGPIASAVPAIGVALVDSPQKALYVVLAFIAIQQIEGHVITPLLLEKRVDVPPVLTILGVAGMGATMGIAGILIAEPLIVVMLILFRRLYVEDAVGDDLPPKENST
jgi:predicted PurR-regulated permease PerM